jgi:hypothetical protein
VIGASDGNLTRNASSVICAVNTDLVDIPGGMTTTTSSSEEAV